MPGSLLSDCDELHEPAAVPGECNLDRDFDTEPTVLPSHGTAMLSVLEHCLDLRRAAQPAA